MRILRSLTPLLSIDDTHLSLGGIHLGGSQFEPLKFWHAKSSGWWFQNICFMFTPGKMIQSDSNFRDGLKSPTRCWKVSLWASMSLGHGEVVTQAESNLGFSKAQGWGHSMEVFFGTRTCREMYVNIYIGHIYVYIYIYLCVCIGRKIHT